MGCIAILPQESQCLQAGQAYLDEKGLPAFYMEDHSIMGLLVEEFDDVVRLLEEHGFLLTRRKDAVEVGAHSPAQMARLFDLLETNRIPFEMRDILECVYQG